MVGFAEPEVIVGVAEGAAVDEVPVVEVSREEGNHHRVAVVTNRRAFLRKLEYKAMF